MRQGSFNALARVVAVALLTASCGTRVSGSAAVEAGFARPGAASQPAGGEPSAVGSVAPSGDSQGTSDAGAAPSAGAAASSGSAATGTHPAAGPATGRPAAGRGNSTPSVRPGSAGPVGGGGGVDTPRSPVVVASVGILSGPAGAVLALVTKGAQVWVQSANARGGLNGHPIRLILFDDRGDPALHRSQIQEAIERHGAIAFLANADAISSSQDSVDYVTSKRVPNIGVDGAGRWYYTTPMWFPQMAGGDPLFYLVVAAVADALVPTGKTKVATLSCLEAPVCDVFDKIWSRHGPPLGLKVVYQARTSFAQPDFTAQCLAARNAGAEIMFVALDANSLGRVASSCDRQGYRPIFSTGSSITTDAMKDNPLLEGMVSSTSVFPWFQKGTPAVDEFQKALKQHGGGIAAGIGVTVGWTAGKLMEKAGANLSEPPTSASLLDGLWSIQSDTLGGLTQPLTFVKDKPASPKRGCYFGVVARKGSWINPDGVRCRDIPEDLAR